MSEINHKYRLRYRKGDRELELEGDKEWIEKIFKEFMKSEIKETIPEGMTTEKGKVKEIPMSLVEFLKSKGDPKEHADLVIAFSYWLFHMENMESYNVDDIRRCYDEARITPPKNPTDTMNKMQGKGWLKFVGEKDGKKAWVITRSGEEYVERMGQ